MFKNVLYFTNSFELKGITNDMTPNFTPCRKVIHNDRLYLMTGLNDDVTIPSQMVYYEELSKIDKLNPNIPKDLKIHNNHCLSMDASSFSEEESEKKVTKALALMNKMGSVSIKTLTNQPKPDTRQIYLAKMKQFMDNHRKVALPYKEWVINGVVYEDLFNTKLYMDLLEIIVTKMNQYSPRVMHGNFSLDNIEKVNNNLVIINPRASFGNGPSLLGDQRCDIAKMRFYLSDIVNILQNDRYIIINSEANRFDYSLLTSPSSERMLKVVDVYIEEHFDPLEIRIFEGCLHILIMEYFKDRTHKKILYARALELLVPSIEKYFSVF